MRRFARAVLLAWPAIALAQGNAVTPGPVVPCNVSAPNRIAAHGPALPDTYGNRQLSIGGGGLHSEGTVVFKPGGSGFKTPDGALGMKFLWQKAVRGALTISGRRLDAPAPPLRFDSEIGHDDDDFQPSYVIFPTVGCWEVTGRVADASLTFVTRVVKIGDGPARVRDVR